MRPSQGKFNLKPEEMDGLTYYVLSGCPREVAFLKFIRPDFIGSKATSVIKSTAQQFFAMKDAKDYIDAYRQTIDNLINPKPKVVAQTGSLEERKAKAKTKLVEFAMNLTNNIENASDPEFVLKLADKAGLLDSEEKAEEQPRRYLPVSCGDCAYRKFVEENCDIVDDGTVLEEETTG